MQVLCGAPLDSLRLRLTSWFELAQPRTRFAGVAFGAVDRSTRYAINDDVHIAYQAIGQGPINLIYTSGIWSNLEIMWEWPAWARYLERLASFARLILFDMRGIGLSDRGSQPPILELQADDVRAVMDAAGCDIAAVFGGARGLR